MFRSVCVVGAGRVGQAAAARLAERLPVRTLGRVRPGQSVPTHGEDELVLLCVPDGAIRDVASCIPPGPWIAHTSGAVSVGALEPHRRRFGLHPLQTFQLGLGPEQFDGAYGAVTGESTEAVEAGVTLAGLLQLTPFELADDERPVYHAAATMAASFLVTLHRAAVDLMEAAGAPPVALTPLMRRTIDNGFAPTGPLVRGDWETIELHRVAIRARRPHLEPLYRALDRRRREAGRSVRTLTTIKEVRAALASLERPAGLVPTMGAFHEGHLSLMRAARAENETVVVSLFVNPTQFGEPADLAAYPRDEERDLALAAATGVDLVFSPQVEQIYPQGFQTWVDVEEVARGMEGVARPGHFRGVATVCLKLFNIVRPDRAYFGQKDAQQAAVIERLVRDLNLELEIRVLPIVRDVDGLALSSRNVHLSADERRSAIALPRALEAGAEAYRTGADPEAAARAILAGAPGIAMEYVNAAHLNGRLILAGAIRVGSTRLIDNVLLSEGGS